MNVKNAISLILLCCLTRCHSQNIPTSGEFDKIAVRYFNEHYDLFDLSPLDERERCILKKQVQNDLDKLNPSKMVVLNDRYVVKSYYSDYLQLPFGFINDLGSNEMYFLSLPELSEFLFDVKQNYIRENDSIYALAIPRHAIKINAALLNDFFFGQGYHIDGDSQIADQIYRANQILDEAFSIFLYNRSSISDLFKQIEMDLKRGLISASAYESIKGLFDDYLNGKNFGVSIYDFQDAGFLIQVYLLNKEAGRLTVEMYFLPAAKRRLISRHSQNPYQDCNL